MRAEQAGGEQVSRQTVRERCVGGDLVEIAVWGRAVVDQTGRQVLVFDRPRLLANGSVSV
jgi:hypothetical protein